MSNPWIALAGLKIYIFLQIHKRSLLHLSNAHLSTAHVAIFIVVATIASSA